MKWIKSMKLDEVGEIGEGEEDERNGEEDKIAPARSSLLAKTRHTGNSRVCIYEAKVRQKPQTHPQED